MVATTVTLRPPSRWYSEETPPRGGPHDPGAPRLVVLREDTTTRGATSEMLITCMSKTLVNAMFFGVKRLPPGDPCCAQSTAVDNSQRNVDSSLSKTLANAMFFRLRRLPPGGLFSKLRIVDFFLE